MYIWIIFGIWSFLGMCCYIIETISNSRHKVFENNIKQIQAEYKDKTQKYYEECVNSFREKEKLLQIKHNNIEAELRKCIDESAQQHQIEVSSIRGEVEEIKKDLLTRYNNKIQENDTYCSTLHANYQENIAAIRGEVEETKKDLLARYNKKVQDYETYCYNMSQKHNEELKELREEYEEKERGLEENFNNKIKGIVESYKQILEDNPSLTDSATVQLADIPKEPTQDNRNVRKWLSMEEYGNLTTSERVILAFDRWKNRRKTRLEIGHEYEMYIGYCYRKDGWEVQQFGIEKGLEDLGRDIIAHKVIDGVHNIHIVQCKRWSQERPIRENTICQLFGTTLQYILKRNIYKDPHYKVIPVLATTSPLSKTAMEFADKLHVRSKVTEPGEYPWIKCNINHDEKIYHLPFDQQYERTLIDYMKGEFYAFTIEEAESKGFRHAMRHTTH